MTFVLDTAIGVCVWLPFTIGKSFALLCVRLFFGLENLCFHLTLPLPYSSIPAD